MTLKETIKSPKFYVGSLFAPSYILKMVIADGQPKLTFGMVLVVSAFCALREVAVRWRRPNAPIRNLMDFADDAFLRGIFVGTLTTYLAQAVIITYYEDIQNRLKD